MAPARMDESLLAVAIAIAFWIYAPDPSWLAWFAFFQLCQSLGHHSDSNDHDVN